MADTSDPLQRFREAQAQPGSGFEAALREIRSGGKRGHWIWYVFPQLTGLGQSAMSHAYAISDAAEAEAYLRDTVLGGRLVTIAEAVRDQLLGGVPLARVMGSDLDASKVVSSLTLFSAVAGRLGRAGVPVADALAPVAEAVLDAAEHEGFPRCAFTESRLGT